jgi:hypothetical protein
VGSTELDHSFVVGYFQPDFDRVHPIGSFWGNPRTRSFAELLIDCEEDWMLRAMLVGMLRDVERR